MKRLIFALLLVLIIVVLASRIPETSNAQYPPPRTPVPPTYVGPIWFGIYCKYPGAPAGYIRVKWDDGFPAGWVIDPASPGRITVFYSPSYYQYRTLSIVEDDVSHIWGTLWSPIQYLTADISGYVHIMKPDGSAYGSYTITKNGTTITHVNKYCPPRLFFLPLLRR